MMPYITQSNRVDIDYRLGPLLEFISSPGDANYVITQVLRKAFDYSHYSDFNAAIGILECCKLEMYRRAVAPYEDQKIRENGDVY